MPELDWTNRTAPADETPETVIRVWEVTVTEGEYDYYLIRGWQDMLDFVRSHMESMLENIDEDEKLHESASITVRLKELSKADYERVCDP